LAAIAILPAAREGYLALGRLSRTAFDSLISRLQAESREFSIADLLQRVRGADEVPDRDSEFILIGLLQLHDTELGPAVTASAIVQALQPDLSREHIDEAEFGARLVNVYRVKSVDVFAKAANLLTRNDKNFLSAKGTTDLRPVFGEDLNAGPQAYVLLHHLELEFREFGAKQNRSFFVSLDERDLDDLISVLDRCRNKASALKSRLEESHVSYVTTNRPNA
jgi:hypothetical protein